MASALPKNKLPFNQIDSDNKSVSDGFGTEPIVEESTLEPKYRVVTSVSQGLQLTETDIKDTRKLIKAAAQITAKKQGDTPYARSSLREQGKAHKTNISTRALATELTRAAPRLYMPILTASTLTAAALPAGWPMGEEKTQFFRETITNAIRRWRKWDTFCRGIAAEVIDYGYGFACFTDPYEWRPHLVRMDKGFVPRGAEVMDDNLARFTLNWEYQPDELLRVARDAVDAGVTGWNKAAVADAVQHAEIPHSEYTMEKTRKFEELVREQVWDYSYEKGYKVIKARHQFILESTGKVSHYLYWPNATQDDSKLLYENLDAYDSMNDVVIPICFGYGDGTIHGSWGAGQLLYDMSVQLEKVRCDSIDNLRMSNKMKIQVPNAKDAKKVSLLINSDTVIVSEGQFANNVGGIAPNPEGYITLESQMSAWMQRIIGSYLPPIPTQAGDVKAAQINASLAQEQEIQRDSLENYLKQKAYIIAAMTKRLMNKDSDDDVAKESRKLLLEEGNDDGIALTDEEVKLLVNQPAIQSVTDFTPTEIARRAQFAQSVLNNSLFKQVNAAKLMASAVGGRRMVDYLVIPDGDTSEQTTAQRQQLQELSTLVTGAELPVVPKDNHWVHMGVMTTGTNPQDPSPMDAMIHAGNVKGATSLLHHYAAHYQSAVAMKALPDAAINEKKSFISSYEKALQALQQQQAVAAQQAQVQQQAAAAQALQVQNQQQPIQSMVPGNVSAFHQQAG
jgi:hypothetical protein